MTSLLREEVSDPIPSARSRTMTSCPASASARAAARPITPAPTTTASTSSTASPRPYDDTRRKRYHIAAMTTFLTLLLVLAMLGVLGVLGMGVATMIRGGDPRRSNKLMQARVVMQGVALLVLALLMMLGSHR